MADRWSADIARAYGGSALAYSEFNADRSFAGPLLDAFAGTLPPRSVVVDLGCGPGWETESLTKRGLRAVGLDVTPDFLEFAVRNHQADGYVAADFLHLPFGDHVLDGARACSSLVHVPWKHIDAALLEVARCIRPGGLFFASMQAGNTEGAVASRTFPDRAFHYAYYDPDQWRERLRAAGFEVINANYHEAAPEHCNPGAHGWIETLARRS